MAFWKAIAIILYLALRQVAVASRDHILCSEVTVVVTSQKCSHFTNTSTNLANACCVTVDDLSDYFPSNGSIKLIFVNQVQVIKKTIVFQNLNSLKIEGSTTPNTILKCKGVDTGLTFDNINSIELTNVRIEWCGAKHVNSIIILMREENQPLSTLAVLYFSKDAQRSHCMTHL